MFSLFVKETKKRYCGCDNIFQSVSTQQRRLTEVEAKHFATLVARSSLNNMCVMRDTNLVKKQKTYFVTRIFIR